MSSKEIFVYISYPRTPEIKFNLEYYLNNHMAIVDKHWRPYGLKGWFVTQFPEGDPSGLLTQAILHFESREAFDKAWAANIPEVMNDLPNYSNTPPQQSFGQLLKHS